MLFAINEGASSVGNNSLAIRTRAWIVKLLLLLLLPQFSDCVCVTILKIRQKSSGGTLRNFEHTLGEPKKSNPFPILYLVTQPRTSLRESDSYHQHGVHRIFQLRNNSENNWIRCKGTVASQKSIDTIYVQQFFTRKLFPFYFRISSSKIRGMFSTLSRSSVAYRMQWFKRPWWVFRCYKSNEELDLISNQNFFPGFRLQYRFPEIVSRCSFNQITSSRCHNSYAPVDLCTVIQSPSLRLLVNCDAIFYLCHYWNAGIEPLCFLCYISFRITSPKKIFNLRCLETLQYQMSGPSIDIITSNPSSKAWCCCFGNFYLIHVDSALWIQKCSVWARGYSQE